MNIGLNESCSFNLLFLKEDNYQKDWVSIWLQKLTLKIKNTPFFQIQVLLTNYAPWPHWDWAFLSSLYYFAPPPGFKSCKCCNKPQEIIYWFLTYVKRKFWGSCILWLTTQKNYIICQFWCTVPAPLAVALN